MMVKILVFVLLIAGLANLIEKNGGVAYLLEKCHNWVTGRRSAECVISILVFIVTAAVGNNTIAILISAPVAKQIGENQARRSLQPLAHAEMCGAISH